jgi:hypothetical protein
MNWNIFKLEMQLYREYLFKIEDLEEERETVFYTFYGVHGVSFDRIPSSHSVDMDIEKRDKFNHSLQPIDKDIDRYKTINQQYERILSSLPEDVQKMARRKFLDNCTYYQVGNEFGYSPNGAYKRIRNEVEKL